MTIALPLPPDAAFGTPVADALTGTTGDDIVDLLAGNDSFDARGGNDVVIGGAGNDRLLGGAGNDTLCGDAGGDWLDGGIGNDTLEGGLGNDHYVITSTDDLIRGEQAYSLGGGIDTVHSGVDYLMGVNLEILRLTGTSPLSGTGNDAPGTIVGNAADNALSGRGGNDQIKGNGGNDALTGGVGRDTLVGGPGADTFILTSISDSRPGQANRDFINGFTHGHDRIDLTTLDANPFQSGLQDWTFIGKRDFDAEGPASAGQVRYFTWGGGNYNIVEGDLRGDGVADWQVFVNLTHWMTGTDFVF